MSYKYRSEEYFVVDQKDTSIINLVDFDINPKYDGSRENLKKIQALVDCLNLKFNDVEYTVPTRTIKIHRSVKSKFKPVHHDFDTTMYRKLFGNLGDEQQVILSSVDEDALIQDVKIPGYKMSKGQGKFKIVVHNFKLNKTYIVDFTGEKKQEVEFFVPNTPIKIDEALKKVISRILEKTPFTSWELLSDKISKFTRMFKDVTGRDLFAYSLDYFDPYARSYTCKMFYYFFMSQTFHGRLETSHPIEMIDILIKAKPPIAPLLKRLAEESGSPVLEYLVELNEENRKIFESRKQAVS